MKFLPSLRSSYFLAFLVIASLFGYSIYLQMSGGFEPCPLCVLQRLTLILLGICFLLGGLFNVKKIGKFIIGSLSFLIALLGVLLSGRQVWLQLQPAGSSNETCAASLDYMIKVLPFDQVIHNIFQGAAECTQVGWRFLSFSLAEWSLLCFGIFLLFSFWQLIRKVK